MIVFRTTPPKYVRQSKTWKSLIGKHGTVLAATQISAQGLELTSQSSYPLVLVEFVDKTRQVLPGIHGEILVAGDRVTCVLRKMRSSTNENIIEYGIKVVKSLGHELQVADYKPSSVFQATQPHTRARKKRTSK